jgi:purine-binding chemotaxis protein CheW
MTESLTLALVRIGRINLAVPAERVDEIVEGPVKLSEFPQAAAHVLGAFARRGMAVPVIDIAALLDSDPAVKRPVNFVLIIRDPRGRFAIQVDEVKGVVKTNREAVTALEPSSGPEKGLFSQLYTSADDGCVSVMLDMDAVLAAEGVRSAVESPSEETSGAGDRQEGATYVLFRAGEACFALDTKVARRIERGPDTFDSDISHPFLRGFHHMLGQLMPVVDVGALLGLPGGGGDKAPNLLMTRGDDASAGVALCIDDVVSVGWVDESRIEPVSGTAGFARPECLRGCFVHEEKVPVLVLDPHAFWQAVQVVDGHALQEVAGLGVKELNTPSTKPAHHLVYKAGGKWLATELAGLESVSKLPPEHIDLRRAGRAFIGMGTGSGQAVTLVDLGMLLGAPPLTLNGERRVLVIASDRGRFGYVVESVNFMELGASEPLPHPTTPARGQIPVFTRMIRIHGENRDGAACVLDLAAVAEMTETG